MDRFLIESEVWIEARDEEQAVFVFHTKNLVGATVTNVFHLEKGTDWNDE